ncbi:MAG: hypothetical protein ACK476_10160 [Fluviicola sp.]|jgi:hypothetical protein
MKILNLILILIVISCSRKTSVNERFAYNFKQKDLALGIAPSDSLSFEYTVLDQITEKEVTALVICALKNHSSKPFYFHTYSCNDWELNFEYDTSKFQVYPSILCNVSRPIIKKIAPHSEFRFTSHFQRKDSTSELNDLSYFVYPVSPDFETPDLNKVNKLEKVVVKNKTK